MADQALGYLGIGTQDIDEWSDFATRQLGLRLVDRGVSRRAFRVDDRRQRVVVDKERPDAERFFRVGRATASRRAHYARPVFGVSSQRREICAVNIGVIVSLVLAILAVLGVFIEIPFVSDFAFWVAVGAYILLAGSYRR